MRDSTRSNSSETPEVPSSPQIPDHELLRKIGRGSYGEVWLAKNVLGTFRAIKIVYRDSFDDDRPFQREFSGIQKFEPISRTHEGFVHILQVGRNEEAGWFYYVMELADDHAAEENALSSERGGRREIGKPSLYVPKTLKSDLARRGRLPAAVCAQLGISLAAALDHLHRSGLVHRDIKPSNIIFVNGTPKLADIGLVTGVDATRSFVGTDGFMPPEGPGSPQADIFSMGKVLYELSMGKDRQDFPEPPTRLREFEDCEQVIELNEVVLKACEWEIARRYQNARELQADLALLLGGKSIKRLRLIERRLAIVIRIGMVLLAVAILAAGAFYQSRRAERKARNRLVQLQVESGVEAMSRSKLSNALVWFAEAMTGIQPGSVADGNHRLRFEAIVRQFPKMVLLKVFPDRVNAAEFSPEGNRFVAATDDGLAQVFDIHSGKALTAPMKHGDFIWTTCFSHDGLRLVTASSDFTARVWDSATGQPITPPLLHGSNVWMACFSQDGKRVATASADATARVWSAATGQAVTPFLRHKDEVRAVAFSPDGTRLATASMDHTVKVWNSTTGEELTPALVHAANVRSVAFSPDGTRIVTASDDGKAVIWDAITGKQIIPPLKHRREVLQALFSPDGRMIATASKDCSVCLWDALTGELVRDPLLHDSPVRRLVFSPDNRRLATMTSDQSARVWNLLTGEPETPPLLHNSAMRSVEFSPDGSLLLTASYDQSVHLWSLISLEAPTLILRHHGYLNSAIFSPNGRVIATCSSNYTLQLWNSLSGKSIGPPQRMHGGIAGMAFLPDSSRLCVIDTSHISQIDAASGRLAAAPLEVSPIGHEISSAFFSHDAKRLVAVRQKTVQELDTVNGSSFTPLLEHRYKVMSAAFSPDGKWFVTGSGYPLDSGEGEARVWDALSGQPAGPPIQFNGGVVQVSFSPDSQRFVTACSDASPDAKAAQIWDVHTRRLLGAPLRHHDGVNCATFSPDGNLIVTGSEDFTARVWNASTGEPLTPPMRHGQSVSGACFSPDGRIVVTASRDSTARIWDARTGEPLTPPLKHSGPLRGALFSPNGLRIVTASEDRTAHVWTLPKTSMPLHDVELLADLLSGQQLDKTGGIVALEPDNLENIWRTMRSRYPEDFSSQQEALLAWHKKVAEEAEINHEWFAARFHWSCLAQASPSDPALRKCLDRAEVELHKSSK
jgi:WD40 repeat protein